MRGPSSYRVRRDGYVARVEQPLSALFWAWIGRRIEKRRTRIAIERWAGRR